MSRIGEPTKGGPFCRSLKGKVLQGGIPNAPVRFTVWREGVTEGNAGKIVATAVIFSYPVLTVLSVVRFITNVTCDHMLLAGVARYEAGVGNGKDLPLRCRTMHTDEIHESTGKKSCILK